MCNFNNTCGHKHDGSLTYQESAQNLEAYRKLVCITVIFNNFQCYKPIILAKISSLHQKVERSAISITHVDTNMMVVTHIKNQVKIWRHIEKESVQL